MTENIYARLASHMSKLAVGLPANETLEEILRENYAENESAVMLAIPTEVEPFKAVSTKQIAERFDGAVDDLPGVLGKLADRGLLFETTLDDGGKGYALHQFGYGMPQVFFWQNEDTPHNRKMADLLIKYSRPNVLTEAYGGADSQVWRGVPVGKTVEPDKAAILPYSQVEEIVAKTRRIALVNCACRVASRLKGRPACEHPLDVCMKYDEMADFVIEKGIGREISKDEALDLNKKAEESGCVHFADNVMPGEAKHACNCCSCSCWSLGNLSRRRIPRDMIMACHFIRATDEDNCAGCGDCVEACPMGVIEMTGDDKPKVDMEWCIGCGVCSLACPTDAIAMVRREEIPDPFATFEKLHETRLAEKASRDA